METSCIPYNTLAWLMVAQTSKYDVRFTIWLFMRHKKSDSLLQVTAYESPNISDQRQSWILDPTLWIPDSRYWIRVSLSVELDFRIPIVRGIRVPWTETRIPKPRIPDSKCKNVLFFGILRPLDPRARTTTSTRFHLKFFRVSSKYRVFGKLHFTTSH